MPSIDIRYHVIVFTPCRLFIQLLSTPLHFQRPDARRNETASAAKRSKSGLSELPWICLLRGDSACSFLLKLATFPTAQSITLIATHEVRHAPLAIQDLALRIDYIDALRQASAHQLIAFCLRALFASRTPYRALQRLIYAGNNQYGSR